MAKIKNPLTIVNTGGGGSTLIAKSITANGTYSAQDDNADGYSEVTVNVPPTMFRSLVDKSITTVTAEDLAGVTSIGNSAFSVCSSLTNITIPDSVTNIGENAFSGCSHLTSVAIPNSVTSIGGSAFLNCNVLTSVFINDLAAWCNISIVNTGSNPLGYNANLYLNNVLLTDLVIPSSITSIRSRAFCRCTSLTKVNIHADVTNIEDDAFYYCINLTRVVVRAQTPLTMTNARAFNYTNDCPIYVPTPDTYKVATNWTTYANRIFPLVATVADLSNIDTTTYTKACVVGADESYKEYTYDGTQWNEVT